MPRDPDQLVDLTTASSEMHAAIIAAALEARGVPAVAVGTAGSVLQWEIAATAPFRVQVRRQDAQRALELLAEVREASIDIDWSELEEQGAFGPPDPDNSEFGPARIVTACTRCGHDRRAIAEQAPCPRCGEQVHQSPRRAGAMAAWVIVVCALGLIGLLMLQALRLDGRLPFEH